MVNAAFVVLASLAALASARPATREVMKIQKGDGCELADSAKMWPGATPCSAGATATPLRSGAAVTFPSGSTKYYGGGSAGKAVTCKGQGSGTYVKMTSGKTTGWVSTASLPKTCGSRSVKQLQVEHFKPVQSADDTEGADDAGMDDMDSGDGDDAGDDAGDDSGDSDESSADDSTAQDDAGDDSGDSDYTSADDSYAQDDAGDDSGDADYTSADDSYAQGDDAGDDSGDSYDASSGDADYTSGGDGDEDY